MMTQAKWAQVVLVFGGLGIAGFLGLITPVLPWWFMLGLGVMLAFAAAVIFWPSAGLVILLGLILEVLPFVPQKFPAYLTLPICAYIILRRWDDIGPVVRAHKIQFFALGALTVCVLVSAIYGYFYQKHFRAYVYSETVVHLYWILFPITALLVSRPKVAISLFKLLISLGILLSIMGVMQSLLKIDLFTTANARLEALDADTGGIAGLARSIVPGTVLVLFTYYCALAAILRNEGLRWLWVMVLVISAFALFVNFGRAIWAAAVLGSLVTALLMGWRVTIRFLLVGGVIAGLLVASVAIFKPDVLEATVDRALSLKKEGGANTSLGWRLTENRYALHSINLHPLFGIGLGGEYKPAIEHSRLTSEQTRYIHNAYLYILLKMGIIGLFVILANYLLLWRSVTRYRDLRIPGSAPRVATSTLLLATLFLSFTQPELFTGGTVAVLAVLTPLALAVRLPVRQTL